MCAEVCAEVSAEVCAEGYPWMCIQSVHVGILMEWCATAHFSCLVDFQFSYKWFSGGSSRKQWDKGGVKVDPDWFLFIKTWQNILKKKSKVE